VSVFTLQANHHAWFSYTVPANGRVRFDVESEIPTSTFVFDPKNFALFQGGQPYVPFGGLRNLRHHSQELTLPFRGVWYLVIMNTSSSPTAVTYTVWS
jgi:hypothetical protein